MPTFQISDLVTISGICSLVYVGFRVAVILWKLLVSLMEPAPQSVHVEMTEFESKDILSDCPKFDLSKLTGETKKVFLWDPSTLDYFGEINAMSEDEVKNSVTKARIAQQEWKKSSFTTRRLLMQTMLKYITENQENCARVAVRESGKTLLDAVIGEVLVTCEKLAWLSNSGEQILQREYRESGRMMIMKRAYVEFIPLGNSFS